MALAVLLAGAFYITQRPGDPGPDRFRATANVSVPTRDPDAEVVDTETPDVLFRSQESLARDQATQDAALAQTPPGDVGVSFSSALIGDGTVMALVATSPDRDLAEAAAGSYANAFIEARREAVAQDLASQQQSLLTRLEQLHARLGSVEADVRSRFGELPVCTPTESEESSTLTPFIPFAPGQSLDGIVAQYERCSLYNRINEGQSELAELRVDAETPGAFAQIFGVSLSRVTNDTSRSLFGPIGGILVAGLVLGLGGAVVVDRMDHTIRHADRAARSLSAPLLSKIPSRRGRRGEATVLLHPDSPRAEAFRDLAATSVATDRLPRAIMVTTPRGDVHDDVAANFAAALADLGVRVALIATSPRQSWFLAPFEVDETPGATLPELLGEAHAGRINGQLQGRLAKTDLSPNLVVLPLGEAPDLSIALDGLPPLLQAMADSEIDVTVVAGPALLDDSSATIVAWATRSVLWAVQAGEVTEEEATTGAARLELAGVSAFGVAVVGAES